jgi:hypothetical protein
MRKNTELSSVSILSIAVAIAILGLISYFLATPLTPLQRIATGHAAISEVLTR